MSERVMPEGWQKLPFLDVCQQIPIAGKKLKASAYQESGQYRVVDQGQETVSGFSDDASLVVDVKAPVIVFGDHTRIVKWIPWCFVPGADGIKVLLPAQEVCPKFFYYQLSAIELPNKGYSRHFKFLKEFEVFIPPLEEQKIITDKLDEMLAQVSNLKARLDAIPAILKWFRQSVLAAAVRGDFTEGRLKGSEYRKVKLENIFYSAKTGLVRSAKEQYPKKDETFPYVKMNNISNEWGCELENMAYVYASQAECGKAYLKDGDWLFNTRNSSELVGKSCVWKGGDGYLYNNNILRVRLIEGYLSEYLEIWFRSLSGKKALEEVKSATTSVAAIYQKKLMEICVDFPPAEEQQETVRRVDQLFVFADQVEQQVKNAQARVDKLTQSILAKAFRGELTAEWRAANPELMSGENAAEALLERIKAEKAKHKPAQKRRRGSARAAKAEP